MKLDLFVWTPVFMLILCFFLRCNFSSDLWLHLTWPEVISLWWTWALSKCFYCSRDRFFCFFDSRLSRKWKSEHTTRTIWSLRETNLPLFTAGVCWFWSTFRNTVFAKAFLPCSCMFVSIYAKKYSICEGLLEREKRNSKNVTAHSYLFSGKQPRKTREKKYHSTHQ